MARGANQRRHRELGCRPVDRLDADRAAMLPLPPVAPVVGRQRSLRLPRDHRVRLDSNDYSVHPAVVGRRLDVTADLTQVTVTCAGRLLAQHVRCWAKHRTLTDPAHAAAAAQLRDREPARPRAVDDVEQRALADYDLAFGLDEHAATAASCPPGPGGT